MSGPERVLRLVGQALPERKIMARHASADGYPLLAIILHWMIAALILGLLALGIAMTRAKGDPALQFVLYQWHKSFGLLVLGLSVVRLVHSLLFVRVAPVPGLARIEHVAARATHALLLTLAVAVPLAGWLVASSSPLAIPTFAFDLVVVPHLPVAKSDAAEAFWIQAHAWLAYLVLGLVLLHAAAAFYHHLLRRDAVLVRMLGGRAAITDAGAKRRRS
jgi:cytochrome b561